MTGPLNIRNAEAADAGDLAHVFFRGAREGAAPKYSEEQRRAWAPEQPSAEMFANRLQGLTTFVAEQDGRVRGFMSLKPDDGYLDFAYVLPEARGTGMADALYQATLAEFRRLGRTHLTTQASLMARSFFQRHGWQVVKAQEIERNGVVLQNFTMSLDL